MWPPIAGDLSPEDLPLGQGVVSSLARLESDTLGQCVWASRECPDVVAGLGGQDQRWLCYTAFLLLLPSLWAVF